MYRRISDAIFCCLVLVQLIIVCTTTANTINSTSNEQQPEFDLNWEYEPRFWLPDDALDNIDELDSILKENNNNDYDQLKELELDDIKVSNKVNTASSLRQKSYFWDVRRRHYGKIDLVARQAAGSDEEKCTQFRVDIRETVICDRQRCDKLDFEWPVHNNQIVVIESTRHGMRFHRSEYAFGINGDKVANLPLTRKQSDSTNTRIVKPVKFDIFDLFKPKPTSTLAPTSSPIYNYLTSSSTTSTTTATTSEDPSTDEGEPTTTPASTETTTASEDAATESSATESDQSTSATRDQENAKVQDKNQTRLVTTFRLDSRRPMQKIIGFGGALSDSSCRNIKSLSPSMARSLMEDYFGPRGLRYNIARLTMGSSDFSTTPYTNNDKPSSGDDSLKDDDWRYHREQMSAPRAFDDGDDVDMNHFHLTEEDYEYKIPIARQAIATSHQTIKFYSSLWSPPIWMKNNSHIVHGWLKGDIYGPYYKALADLIVKWLEAYRKQGIEFWATTGLNEPVTGIKPFIFHNSLGITREDYVTFIKLYLGPMLRQRGFNKIKLIALDDNKGYAPQLANAILKDKEASKFVSGIGVHWYMNDEYENLNFLAKDYPDKFILSTEASNGYLPFQVHTLPGDWDRGVAYMYDIIKLMHKNVAGWVDWNMALDLYGGPSWAKNNLDSPIIVNAERDEYYKSPMFYAIGHFSRFIEPDSYRLDHRIAYAKYDYPLEAAAFMTPKERIVIVVLNANRHRVPFRIIVDRKVVRVLNLREDSFSTIIFNWKGGNI